jgi:hypothetical protein
MKNRRQEHPSLPHYREKKAVSAFEDHLVILSNLQEKHSVSCLIEKQARKLFTWQSTTVATFRKLAKFRAS